MAARERSSREWLNTMTGEVSDRVEEKGMGTSPMIIQGPSAVHQSRGFSVSLWAHISSGGLIFQDQQEDTDPIHWISVINGAAASPINWSSPNSLVFAITSPRLLISPSQKISLNRGSGCCDFAVRR